MLRLLKLLRGPSAPNISIYITPTWGEHIYTSRPKIERRCGYTENIYSQIVHGVILCYTWQIVFGLFLSFGSKREC